VPLETQTPYGTLALNIGGLASSLPVAKIEKDLGPRLVALAHRVDEMLRTTGFTSAWDRGVASNGATPRKQKEKKHARVQG
jgi:hypothetical protein